MRDSWRKEMVIEDILYRRKWFKGSFPALVPQGGGLDAGNNPMFSNHLSTDTTSGHPLSYKMTGEFLPVLTLWVTLPRACPLTFCWSPLISPLMSVHCNQASIVHVSVTVSAFQTQLEEEALFSMLLWTFSDTLHPLSNIHMHSTLFSFVLSFLFCLVSTSSSCSSFFHVPLFSPSLLHLLSSSVQISLLSS